MYLCIEGLDGSGKSTLFLKLKKRLQDEGYLVTEACPTRIVKPDTIFEKVFRRSGFLRSSSLFRALVYGLRSRQTANTVNWDTPIVLGDRSIITSYVTRWRKWLNSKRITIAFVELMEPTIPAPDVVLYIDLPADILKQRLNARGKPLDIDESTERSLQMRSAYSEIINFNPIKRLEYTKWISLPLNEKDCPDTVLEKAFDAITNNTDIKKLL